MALAAASPPPALMSLSVPEEVLWDYRTTRHSVRGHPLQSLRPWLEKHRLSSSERVRLAQHGTHLQHVGLVICRQRPGTATGVVFLTLEDEFGFVNVVVWSQVYERHTRVVRTASLLGVRGHVQSADGVVHLIADQLFIPELELPDHAQRSRDFH